MSETVFPPGRVLPVGLSQGERELCLGSDFWSVPGISSCLAPWLEALNAT